MVAGFVADNKFKPVVVVAGKVPRPLAGTGVGFVKPPKREVEGFAAVVDGVIVGKLTKPVFGAYFPNRLPVVAG